MAKEFIVLKMDNTDVALDIFKGISNSLVYEIIENVLVIDINITTEDLNNIVLTLETELYQNVVAFKSNGLFSDRRDEMLQLIIPLIKKRNNGLYDFKRLLLESYIINKEEMLSFILYRTGVNEHFIESFAQNDLNASKACKDLFMHRNTVLYKVEKLLEMTGFDVRCFIDTYILYSLIEKCRTDA